MPQPKHLLDPLAVPSSSRIPRRTPKRPSRRSPKQSSSPYSFPDPSSGLLALLVTVAGSPPVDARPLEPEILPDFLCPRLHIRSSPSSTPPEDDFSWSWEPCDPYQAATYYQSPDVFASIDQSTRPRKKHTRGATIADKYEQSSDGRWRKADSWELYGSSSCAAAQCMDSAPTGTPVEDDQVSSSSATPSSTATATSASTAPTLPNGWDKTLSADDMTGVILALSLSLAIALILFMIGIVLWRRKRRKVRDPDMEKTPEVSGSEPSQQVKLARSQQRIWSRASAKWLANVRQSARRRRKLATSIASKGSETDLLDNTLAPRASSSAVSLARPPSASDHASSYVSRPLSRNKSAMGTRSRSSSVASTDVDVLSQPSPHPPAYILDASARSHPRAYSYHSDGLSSSHRYLHTHSSSAYPDDRSLSLPYEPSTHSAHVATDDKAVLARIARMASAPPGNGHVLSDALGASSEMSPSVPILEDEPFESLPPETRFDANADVSERRLARRASTSAVTPDTSCPSLHASLTYPGSHPHGDSIDSDVPPYAEDAIRHRVFVLPPPPAKVALAGPMFYEYPNEFEDDIANIDPPLGPSSPPFEDASAPPFGYELPLDEAVRTIAPSAPPLEFADALPPPTGFIPSAPPLDDGELTPRSANSSADISIFGSAPPPAPDDHRSVRANAGPASQSRASRSGDTFASPPQYLP